MRRVILAFVTVASLLIGAPVASAGETYLCWYAWVVDEFGNRVKGMKCRIDGVIHEPGFPGEPGDITLVYDVGYDSVGECYYRRTGAWPGWIPLASNGTLILFGYDPDGIPGGPYVGDAWIEQCISEPTPGEPPRTQVYNFLSQYTFAEPQPDVVPAAIGLTGATTWLNVDPPPPVIEQLVSPYTGELIEIEIRVITVTIRWGDDTEVSIPESEFDLFAPHPDGNVGHTWQTKDDYSMEVDYNWFVRWRVGAGSWNAITVPATGWSSPYQVDEVVGRRSG